MTEHVIVSQPADGVTLVQLNRPKSLNALSDSLMRELIDALRGAHRCAVITGNEKAFAAGADISQMSGSSSVDMYRSDYLSLWDEVASIPIPLIAAAQGWCLGGGCELAMACDIIIAGESAKFGQPEIALGLIPGAGGTQRLTKAIGKSRAMEMILTGEPMEATEAARRGLVSRVVADEALLDEALALASKIAAQAPIAVALAKESIRTAYEASLCEGVRAERHNFVMLFATDDAKEGVDAFVSKRKPTWSGK